MLDQVVQALVAPDSTIVLCVVGWANIDDLYSNRFASWDFTSSIESTLVKATVIGDLVARRNIAVGGLGTVRACILRHVCCSATVLR